MEKLKALFSQYGSVAIGVYLATYVVAIAVALSSTMALGGSMQTGTGIATGLGAAWLATRATLPLRILVTVALTPFVARLLKRDKKPAATTPASADPPKPSAT